MRPRTAVLAVLAVIVVAAAYSAYWFVAAGWLRDGVDAWSEARRAEGLAVERQGLELSGFPFRLVAEIAAPKIERPRAWSWSAERLVIVARPWSFGQLRLVLPREQRLTQRRGTGAARVFTLAAQRGFVLLTFGSGRLDGVTVEAAGVALATADDEIRLGRLDASGLRTSAAAIDLDIAIEDLVLPPRVRAPLGRKIARLAVDGTIEGEVPAAPIADALAAWSAAGGRLDPGHVAVRWGALSVDAVGTLTLDDELRPLAAMTAEIVGYAAVLEALAKTGAIKARDASLATIALGLLAKPGPNGARVLTVPLTAQNGTLYVGPLALLRLAPVVAR